MTTRKKTEYEEELRKLFEQAEEGKILELEERWFEEAARTPILDAEGKKKLLDCRERASGFGASEIVIRRKNALEKYKAIRAEIPKWFRDELNYKKMYRSIVQICKEEDIPQSVANNLIGVLCDYIETGRCDNVLIYGSPGIGKTTAIKRFFSEALGLYVHVTSSTLAESGRNITGEAGSFQDASYGVLAEGQILANNRFLVYLFEEIDKVSSPSTRASVDQQLLTITDQSCSTIREEFMEIPLVNIQNCPKIFTANDPERVNHILKDRCLSIEFEDPSIERLQSVIRKYLQDKMKMSINHSYLTVDYEALLEHVALLRKKGVVSIRKHEQAVDLALLQARSIALGKTGTKKVMISEKMFEAARKEVLQGCSNEDIKHKNTSRKIGFI